MWHKMATLTHWRFLRCCVCAMILPRGSSLFSTFIMLCILNSLATSRANAWQMKQAPLMTPWAALVNTNAPLPEYPRPQMVRTNWLNLNGIWQFQPGETNDPVPVGQTLSSQILVPYPMESALSGVMQYSEFSWYRRTFTVPAAWSGKHIILHLDAVDWQATVYVNGQEVGIHKGGYDPITYDITSFLNSGTNELIVNVYSPEDNGGEPRGKQTLYPGGIMYTSSSGIWQPAWLEPVDASGISDLQIVPDVDNAQVLLTVNTYATNAVSVTATVLSNGVSISSSTGSPDTQLKIPVKNPNLWSPDNPFLYDLQISTTHNGAPNDSVSSYFGMRKISITTTNGVPQIFLNNQPFFEMGPLDQGYWPDGIYTAPTDAALEYDLQLEKAFGFNTVRKHEKVERQRWYYWADVLGLLVWQDMPTCNSYTSNPQPVNALDFIAELTAMVTNHWNSPCIMMWDIFNEGQGQTSVGQTNTPYLVNLVETIDPNHLVNQGSGGDYYGVGNVYDVHSYPNPGAPGSTTQVPVDGEFGGIAWHIPDHLWNPALAGTSYTLASSLADFALLYDGYIDDALNYESPANGELNAAIYTQITDVENECDGLMSYDRLVKPDMDSIYSSNLKAITGQEVTPPQSTPVILLPPASQTIFEGGTASFSAQATGYNLNYQWDFDGSAIAGATNNFLILTNLTGSMAGTYGIVASNSVGSATDSVTLTVVAPGPPVLQHRYSFVSDATDSVGGANGTIVPPNGGAAATIHNGLYLPGNTEATFGYSGYVSLPAGLLTTTTNLTVECWVTQNQGNNWAEVWDFGSSTTENFALIPYPVNNNNNMEVAFTPNSGEVDMQSSILFPNNSEQYVCVTYNYADLTGNLCLNGNLAATQVFPSAIYTPGLIGGGGGTTEDMLGNDVYGDDQFSGTVYELRIWNGVVSPEYIAASAVAGPGTVITNLAVQYLSISLSTTSMADDGTQQATVSGNLLQVSNVTLTASVTNWASSNPEVLTVNSSGLIMATGGGTATISATVNGVSATSAPISVPPNTSPTFTQKPGNLNLAVNDTATFSAAGLGGGLSYQWEFDGNPISGATSATLVLTNLSLTNAGTYTVVLLNNVGSTNDSAVLNVTQAILLHRYSFISNASDSVGGANGALVAGSSGINANIANGLILPGNTIGGFGYSGYVSLPDGLLTNTTSITIESWFTQNQGNEWATVWDFADSSSVNFELCPTPASNRNNGQMISAFTPDANEDDLDSDITFPNGSEQYVAETVNAFTLVGNLYTNGLLVGTITLPNSSFLPDNIGGQSGTVQDMLGNDTFGDDQFSGTIYEFRVWDGAVTPLYLAVATAAGPSVVVTNLTPTAVDLTVTNSSMTQGGSQPAVVTVNFTEASGLVLTSSATNWTSSNPDVLTVNGNGMITAVNSGSATISATLNGVTGTSSLITVQNSAPKITQQPQASETLLAGTSLNATVDSVGTPPFVYRWYLNNGANPVSTAATPALTITNLQPTNAGVYSCLVSNQYGAVLSSNLDLTVVVPNKYQQSLLSLNPMAYWPLNETSGTTAYDLVGGYNGTYVGGCTLAQAGPTNSIFNASSRSVLFDGASGYVDIPEGPFNITGPITVVAWVNLVSVPTFAGIIGHGDDSWRMSVNSSAEPGANDGNLPADATSPSAIDDGNWHMIAYTYTGIPGSDNGLLFVDGTLVATQNVTAAPAGDSLDVWIGGSPDYGTARLLNAKIADASIFTRALTATQVQDLDTGVYAGPVNLAVTLSGSSIVLTWQAGSLLQAPTVLGPWTTNSAAVSPYTVPLTNGNQFFKVLVNP